MTDFVAAMPKAENHVHLEGATQPEILLKLAERNGYRLPVDTVEALRELYVFRDFNDFLKVYKMIVSVLRTEDDFAEIAYEFGAEMAVQNIRYAEVTYSPQVYVFGTTNLSFDAILEALNDGRRRAEEEFGVQMRWIPDIVRNVPQYGMALAEWVVTPFARDGGVVALGLGGMEIGFPPERFSEPFAYARERGVPGNPHAGETVGAESVWGALNALQAVRIGHGVRASEDPELVKHLAERGIPLEVCPTSNLCLRVYDDYAAHPFKKLMDAGCVVTLNSDDPPLFNTSLTDEYRYALSEMGLTRAELEQCALNALRVSYLPQDEKNRLIAAFEAEYDALRD